jgi:hypothetical protein
MHAAAAGPWFMLTFLGAPLLAGLSMVLSFGRGGAALAWTIAGFGGALVTFVVTAALNVPLNDALAAAGDPDRIVGPGRRARAVRAELDRVEHGPRAGFHRRPGLSDMGASAVQS